jgi:myo-inositol-1(or 4)-monophosphatase
MANERSIPDHLSDLPAAALDQRYAAACSMAADVGRLLLTYFRGKLETRIKAHSSTVSEADHAAETELRRRITAQFADDSVLGEEYGLEARDDTWCWTLDPLDGTHNFVGGIPVFSVAVGVLYRRQPVIGVIHDPCPAETYAAAWGRGARRGDELLHVDERPLDRLSLVAVRHRFLRGPRAPLLDMLPTRKFRCTGSLCLELAYVAAGALHGSMAGSARLWELGPGSVLIEEAGGVVRDLGGEAIFPLPQGLAAYTDHRFPMLGGSERVVEQLAAHLRRVSE